MSGRGPGRRRGGRRHRQQGMALALALVFTAVLSVLVGMILFSSEYETVSATNYAAQQHAFYAADAGLQTALNWFENDYETLHNTNTALYTATTTPVETASNSEAVVLDATGGSSNYPTSGVTSSFASTFGTGGGVSVGTGGETYVVKATLTVLRNVTTASGVTTAERWQIQSVGSWVEGSRVLAQATLNAYIEPQTTPLMNDVMFTTGATCGSISVSGNVTTDSYNSSQGTYTQTHSNTEGNIGTNGNITASGNVDVYGTATVPGGSAKNGACSASSPGGITSSGNISIAAEAALSSTQVYPSPAVPSPWNLSTYEPNNGHAIGSTLTPGNYGDISISGNTTLVLEGGTGGATNVYNINSITYSGNTTIEISPTGPVIINLVGQGQSSVLTASGNSTLNLANSGTARDLTINYAGTGSIALSGNNEGAFVLYAPSASLALSGNTDYFGSIIAQSIAASGNVSLHYDMSLFNSLAILSNYQIVGWTRSVE